VRIAVMVLIVTQLFNLVLVPLFAQAGLTLAIGLGALVNAGALLWGLIRRGRYTPSAGWSMFFFQVIAATALLAIFLIWTARTLTWIGPAVHDLQRIGMLAMVLAASAAIYFLALWGAGLKLRQFLRA
jgi:putative peptidoglycan lipid II flippase